MSETGPGQESPNATRQREVEEIGLMDLAIILARRKWLVLGVPFAAAIIAAIVSLSLPNIYTATTRILAPQPQATPAMLAQLDNVAGLAASVPGLRNPADLYVGMLKSRTIVDNLVQRFDLTKRYGHTYLSDTRAALESGTKIFAGRDSIITIDVEDVDPRRAAALANGYVEELLKLSNVLALTAASQRRLFLEQQVTQARENLAKAEVAARDALEKGGLANVDAQSRAILGTTASLRAQIAAKEIEIGAMRTFATGRNPELIRAQDALSAMKAELGRIEGARGVSGKENGPSPTLGLDNVRLLREVRYNEILFEVLARQYEVAKLEEANEAGIIQVLDKAIEPERKSRPKRMQYVLIAAGVGLVAAVVWALISEILQRAMLNPVHARRLQTLKEFIRLR